MSYMAHLLSKHKPRPPKPPARLCKRLKRPQDYIFKNPYKRPIKLIEVCDFSDITMQHGDKEFTATVTLRGQTDPDIRGRQTLVSRGPFNLKEREFATNVFSRNCKAAVRFAKQKFPSKNDPHIYHVINDVWLKANEQQQPKSVDIEPPAKKQKLDSTFMSPTNSNSNKEKKKSSMTMTDDESNLSDSSLSDHNNISSPLSNHSSNSSPSSSHSINSSPSAAPHNPKDCNNANPPTAISINKNNPASITTMNVHQSSLHNHNKSNNKKATGVKIPPPSNNKHSPLPALPDHLTLPIHIPIVNNNTSSQIASTSSTAVNTIPTQSASTSSTAVNTIPTQIASTSSTVVNTIPTPFNQPPFQSSQPPPLKPIGYGNGQLITPSLGVNQKQQTPIFPNHAQSHYPQHNTQHQPLGKPRVPYNNPPLPNHHSPPNQHGCYVHGNQAVTFADHPCHVYNPLSYEQPFHGNQTPHTYWPLPPRPPPPPFPRSGDTESMLKWIGYTLPQLRAYCNKDLTHDAILDMMTFVVPDGLKHDDPAIKNHQVGLLRFIVHDLKRAKDTGLHHLRAAFKMFKEDDKVGLQKKAQAYTDFELSRLDSDSESDSDSYRSDKKKKRKKKKRKKKKKPEDKCHYYIDVGDMLMYAVLRRKKGKDYSVKKAIKKGVIKRKGFNSRQLTLNRLKVLPSECLKMLYVAGKLYRGQIKENVYDKRKQHLNDYFDDMVKKAKETKEDGEDEDANNKQDIYKCWTKVRHLPKIDVYWGENGAKGKLWDWDDESFKAFNFQETFVGFETLLNRRGYNADLTENDPIHARLEACDTAENVR